MMKLNKQDQEALEWGEKNIKFVGNKHTNKWKTRTSDYHNRTFTPRCIVNHISDGSMQSLISWFTSKNNKGSSSHFGVGRDGSIVQFVKIEDRAWCNGKIKSHTSDLVSEMGVWINPNHYSISIEHAGIYNETKGQLTPAQLDSSIKLHAYIIAYVKKYYDHEIEINRKYIMGHYEIDNIGKINCPGQMFQWRQLISGITELTGDKFFIDIDGHWASKQLQRALNLGLLSGDGTNELKPDKPLTKAEATSMMLKLYDLINGTK